MLPRFFGLVCLALVLTSSVFASRAHAQFSINWWTVDGGGGTSTGGTYTLSGTIGQPDAGTVMTGGSYSLTGGFWVGAVPPSGCNDLDFNNDGNIEPLDVDAYFSILGEGPCLGGTTCDSLDFNNDGNIEPEDVDAYFSVLGEGPCINN